jgi:hypothetical protein
LEPVSRQRESSGETTDIPLKEALQLGEQRLLRCKGHDKRFFAFIVIKFNWKIPGLQNYGVSERETNRDR